MAVRASSTRWGELDLEGPPPGWGQVALRVWRGGATAPTLFVPKGHRGSGELAQFPQVVPASRGSLRTLEGPGVVLRWAMGRRRRVSMAVPAGWCRQDARCTDLLCRRRCRRRPLEWGTGWRRRLGWVRMEMDLWRSAKVGGRVSPRAGLPCRARARFRDPCTEQTTYLVVSLVSPPVRDLDRARAPLHCHTKQEVSSTHFRLGYTTSPAVVASASKATQTKAIDWAP